MWGIEASDIQAFLELHELVLKTRDGALKMQDRETLRMVDAELKALPPASAVRASSIGVGKRLLSAYGSICGDERFPAMARDSRTMRGKKPFVFTNLKTREGVDNVVSWIRRELLFEA